MKTNTKAATALLSYLLVSGCTPMASSQQAALTAYKPAPPAWFIGKWVGEDLGKENKYTFTVGTDQMTKEVMTHPKNAGDMTASSTRHYHGFNGSYTEKFGDGFYELRPTDRSVYFEQFTLQASGTVEYLYNHSESATKSVELTKR